MQWTGASYCKITLACYFKGISQFTISHTKHLATNLIFSKSSVRKCEINPKPLLNNADSAGAFTKVLAFQASVSNNKITILTFFSKLAAYWGSVSNALPWLPAYQAISWKTLNGHLPCTVSR